MGERYIGIDFGGSNLRIAEVNPETGEVIGPIFKRSLDDVLDNESLNSILPAILQQIAGQLPSQCRIGISAAGTVDEKKRIITMSPNSKIKGEINFGKCLMEGGYDVVMTNDMRAAVCAAATFGEGKEYENVLVATYSSGYNSAVARKRKVVTKAEFGHLVYETDNELRCGCGGTGHLETAVSGNGARDRAVNYIKGGISDTLIMRCALEDLNRKSFSEGKPVLDYDDLLEDHNLFNAVLNSVSSKHVYQAFDIKPGGLPQVHIRNEQVRAIAVSFGMMNSAYNPLDIMVLMGSQTNDWKHLFVPAIELYKKEILQLPSLPHPKIVRTELPEIGVQGAVAYLLSQ